jgi:hypothetical protein
MCLPLYSLRENKMQDKAKMSSGMKRLAAAAVVAPVFIAYVYYLPAFP